MQLYEQYRPAGWPDVIGQDKILAKLDALRKRGLAGRSYWITGPSGTGKTTIARLIAQEVAEGWLSEEYDTPRNLTPADIKRIVRAYDYRPMGQGVCVIVNESHGLHRDQIEKLLGTMENAPDWMTWIFTTTNDGDTLFDENLDAGPFGSRCIDLPLSRRGLAQLFAERVRMIAQAEGLDGQPIEAYLKLAKKHKNNMRWMLQDVDGGCMAVGE